MTTLSTGSTLSSDYLTSSTAGTTQITGLTSDTQWADYVDEMVEAQRYHITRLETWRSEWTDKKEVISTLDAYLQSLELNAGDMNEASEFFSRTSSSSNEDVLSITNTSLALPGSHKIVVGENLVHRTASQGWADKDTTSFVDDTSDFVIQVGDKGTITIDASDVQSNATLEGLRDLINASTINDGGDYDGESGVTAEIIEDGSGDTPYRLVITGVDGGPDNEIVITKNPTRLNFYDNDISPADTSNLSGTTTTEITTMGHFTEDKETIGGNIYRKYTFTGPSSQQTVGSGDWTISWSGDSDGGSGTINLGSDYTPGDSIEIEDGIFIKFDEGVFEGGSKEFTVKAYSSNVSDIETDTWSGTSTVTSDGHYLGGTSKNYSFSISGDSSINVGTDSFSVKWDDGAGNKGTVEVTSNNYDSITIAQGIKLSFSSGTVSNGDTFTLKAYSPTLQKAQEKGLAQVEIETHSGFRDMDSSYITTTDSTFSYTYAGVTRTIDVPANSTLYDLYSLINDDDENPGVTATIMNDGSGLDTAYHLQLIGNDTGQDNKIENISHTLNNFGKGGSTGYGFSQTQAAQNTMLKVDGYPEDDNVYLQRSTNTIGDLLLGTTISVLDVGESTVSINDDIDAISEKIHEFVDTLNNVLDYIVANTAHVENGDSTFNGRMIGNYSFQIIQQRLKGIMTSSIPGLEDGTDLFTHLSQIGITTEDDTIQVDVKSSDTTMSIATRKFTIDETLLQDALKTNVKAVSKLFISDSVTGVDGIAELIRNESDTLNKDYTDENPGILQVLNHNYDDIIENIDKKIEREERRIALVENRLNEKFSKFETMLGELNGQQSAVDQLMNSDSSS